MLTAFPVRLLDYDPDWPRQAAERALAYMGRWDANEELPRNPAHLLRYALARSGLSQRKVCITAGVSQATLAQWCRGSRGPIEARFPRVNLVESGSTPPEASRTDQASSRCCTSTRSNTSGYNSNQGSQVKAPA